MRLKPITLLTGLSLLANLLLIARLTGPERLPKVHSLPSPQAQAPALPAGKSSPSPRTVGLLTASVIPQDFHWSHVESTNFITYAANLRAAGFPEKAIQEALVPLVYEHYQRLMKTSISAATAPRWIDMPEESRRQHQQHWDALNQELKQVMEFSFGSGFEQTRSRYEIENYHPWHLRGRQEDFGFLKDEVRNRLQALKKERSDRRASLISQGLQGQELQTALQPLINRQEEEMHHTLPPEVVEKLLSRPQ